MSRLFGESKSVEAMGRCIEELRRDLDRERNARKVVDATVRSLAQENERLKAWCDELETQISFESVTMFDPETGRAYSVTDAALLELLRAEKEGRLIVLPEEENSDG